MCTHLDCNQFKHTKDTFKCEQLLQQIQALYSIQDSILQRDQYMFNTPLEEWAQKPILSLEEWLHKNKAVIKQCLTNAKKQLKLNGSDIRKFYPSTKDTPVTTHKEARKRKTAPARKLLQQQKLNNHLVVTQPRAR
eukprot:scaffold76773_cov34-Attheya_sp.AAC.1